MREGETTTPQILGREGQPYQYSVALSQDTVKLGEKAGLEQLVLVAYRN